LNAASWRPGATRERLELRAAMLAAAREFFAARDVLEVDTPVLAPETVTEPHIHSLRVEPGGAAGGSFLQPSPEYAMKRLLAAGLPDIYQLGPAFRGGELGRRHQPEFCLLEWYRQGFSLADMQAETCALINALGSAAGLPPARVDTIRYRDLFLRELALDPLSAGADAVMDTVHSVVAGELDAALADELGQWPDAALDLLLSQHLIPALPHERLTVVSHFPAGQAALARLAPDDPGCAERFEVFFRGLELANGYRECTDAAELAARFARDRERRRAAGLSDRQVDAALLAAVEAGLPECSGVAVGFDRVMMAWLGAEDIREVRAFAYPAEKAT
jgi:lysyl-tRNA synthetase class 2